MSQINENQEIQEVLSSQNAQVDDESMWGLRNDIERLAERDEKER